jgi:hypothetical protein
MTKKTMVMTKKTMAMKTIQMTPTMCLLTSEM